MAVKQYIIINEVQHVLTCYTTESSMTYDLASPSGQVGRCRRSYNARTKAYTFELTGDRALAEVARTYFN